MTPGSADEAAREKAKAAIWSVLYAHEMSDEREGQLEDSITSLILDERAEAAALAVAREREECAKIAEAHYFGGYGTAHDIAREIRARSAPGEAAKPAEEPT